MPTYQDPTKSSMTSKEVQQQNNNSTNVRNILTKTPYFSEANNNSFNKNISPVFNPNISQGNAFKSP